MAAKRQSKSKKFTIKMKTKLFVIFLLTGLSLIALSLVIIGINLKKGKNYSKAVYDNFTYDSRNLPARRGDITDRNGTILAYSTKVYNLIIDTKVMLSNKDYRKPTVEALQKSFPALDIAELNAFIDENVNKSNRSSYKRFLQELTEDEIKVFTDEQSKSKLIKGVWFESEYKRTYPFGSLAADVIGFATGQTGELGVEQYYNQYLSGTDGRTYGYINDSSYQSQVIPAINGNTIVSTIDYGIQNIIEKAIKNFNDEYGSLSTTVVVMNPNNGEILGMADYPTFDLNNPRDIEDLLGEDFEKLDEEEKVEEYYKIWKNNAISMIYEPGSVFKSITISELVEENLVDYKDVFECNGYGIYNSSKILCHGGHGHGKLTVTGALCESCNDCLMQFGDILGKSIFQRYIELYKFGQKTEVDLPSEEAGLLIAEKGMMDVDLATNSFGQNLSVNMLQMMGAYASIINGGKYYKPHVVKEILDSSGELVKEIIPTLVTQTVSKETSDIMRNMMRAVVDYGTGGYVYKEGYTIGGKTGAAEKIPRDKQSYVISFMGFAPVENPEILCYVVIDTPHIEPHDTSYAALLLSIEIYKELLPYVGITQTNTEYDKDLYLCSPEGEVSLIRKRTTIFDLEDISTDGGANLPEEGETVDEEEEEKEKETSSEEPTSIEAQVEETESKDEE